MSGKYSNLAIWAKKQSQRYISQAFQAQNSATRGVDEATVNTPTQPEVNKIWQDLQLEYPQVLEYFFGSAKFTMPAIDEDSGTNSPLRIPYDLSKFIQPGFWSREYVLGGLSSSSEDGSSNNGSFEATDDSEEDLEANSSNNEDRGENSVSGTEPRIRVGETSRNLVLLKDDRLSYDRQPSDRYD